MTFPNYSGPYKLGTAPAVVDGKEATKPWRHNDGAMNIMSAPDEYGDRHNVLTIPMLSVRPKRGEAWKTTDPEQEAFAAYVVAILNAGAA